MCGICGHYSYNGSAAVDVVKRMNAALLHRGPDSDGFMQDAELAMAMRRLAIIDKSGGKQPIWNEGKNIVVTFNGEIYNFQKLRSELISAGHIFRTKSDTEVIVHGYEEWGNDIIEKLNGMFAFALWDAKKRRLLIARDRMGEKPVYWHMSKKGFIWSSELKSLLLAPWVRKELDLVALHHYLSLQYVPDPLTMFQGIHKLPAAHKIVVEKGQMHVERWWQNSFEPKVSIPLDEAVRKTRECLEASIESRLIAEVPVGAFLSGGVDSSTIVAVMSQKLREPVRTYSVAFTEQGYSENVYAEEVARVFGTQHTALPFGEAEFLANAEAAVICADDPCGDSAIVPLYALSKRAKEDVTVVLAGEGGDETMAGYSRYKYDASPLVHMYSMLAPQGTEKLLHFVIGTLQRYGLRTDHYGMSFLMNLLHLRDAPESASVLRSNSFFSHHEKIALYRGLPTSRLDTVHTAKLLSGIFKVSSARGRLEKAMATDLEWYLSRHLVQKTDRATMAHALEARLPFLDPEWVDWSSHLPPTFKLRNGMSKWILKEAFKDLLPQGIRTRNKAGFSVPIRMWIGGKAGSWMRDRIFGNPIMHEWFREQEIERMFREHREKKRFHELRLWALTALSIWHSAYAET